ncbi:hypothetical protein HRbin33_00630 [bacterium HR33]|nr:hypothetical protein HRbin33_00630 [bacterium HR33]
MFGVSLTSTWHSAQLWRPLSHLPRLAEPALRRSRTALERWARSVTPERLFWAIFLALLVLYVALLVLGQTAVGRGGR